MQTHRHSIESFTEATEVQKCPQSLKALDTFPTWSSFGTCPRLARLGPLLSKLTTLCAVAYRSPVVFLSISLSLSLSRFVFRSLLAFRSLLLSFCYLNLSGSYCSISWNVTALATVDLIYLAEWRVLLLWYSKSWGLDEEMLSRERGISIMYGLHSQVDDRDQTAILHHSPVDWKILFTYFHASLTNLTPL